MATPTPSQEEPKDVGIGEVNLKAAMKNIAISQNSSASVEIVKSLSEVDRMEEKGALETVVDRAKFETADLRSGEEEAKDDERFKLFEEWLLNQGAEFPDLYLKKYTNTIRGVHAIRSIEPYETIVAVPLKCLITDYMGRTETKIGRQLFATRNTLSTPNLIAVVVYMLETREDPSHFFQPYYNILPSDYSNFPIFWDEEKLAWLKGSPLLEDIEERKQNMRGDYDEVCEICPEFARFSFDEFLEIRTAVGSRNFGIVVDGEKRTAMVPHADMLNHYRPRETSWTFDNQRQAFTITSLAPLMPDQQVMDSYGKKCNSKFLLHYGFAVEVNREEDGKCQNEVYVRVSLRDEVQDPLRSTRLSFLGPSRAVRHFRLSMNIEDKTTADCLSYLRVAVANEEDLGIIMARFARQQLSSPNIRFVSIRNEVAALGMLAEILREHLTGYPNTYEENCDLLVSGKIRPFSDRRTALVVVLGEQEICQFWIRTAEIFKQGLEGADPITAQAFLKHAPRTTLEEKDRQRYATFVLSALRNSLSNNSSFA